MMRVRRKTVYIGSIFGLLWACLVYITLLNQPPSIKESNSLDNDLYILEQGIGSEFKRNRDMVNNLHRFFESKTSLSKEDIKDDKPSLNIKKGVTGTTIPVLVFACNRVSVARCIDQLLQYRPDPDQFPIIISQDCDHSETTEVINRYGSQVSLIRQPDQSDIEVPLKEKKFKGYFKIARHYGWALNEMFFNFNFDTVIIVEDDLNISPDFFEYFMGLYPILVKDPTIWCISAWNDNGKSGLINENRPDLLYRTDFFPGLGWMLTKDLWTELKDKWPRSYWDDWIRQPEQRKDRSCIRPEISRTRTFGKIGVSNGLFYEKHLKYIKLNEQFVPFTKMNLTYLVKDVYDPEFIRNVYQSAIVSYQELKDGLIAYDGSVRIVYHTRDTFRRTAKMLGLMDEFRSGVPRTAYKGIITFHYRNRTVYLAPNINWKGYDLWN